MDLLQSSSLRNCLLGLAVLLACSAAPSLAAGETIPQVHGHSFAGAAVELPGALQGKVGILVIGFSQGARKDVEVWGTRLASTYDDKVGVAYYELPVLASVPKLLRGFVTGRIDASVAKLGKPHFVVVDEHEAEWRKITHYTAPDDAYVLVVDGNGSVRWQTQGLPLETTYTALKQHVDALTAEIARRPGR